MEYFIKQGLCPFCGQKLPQDAYMVTIHLSNNTIMPQPVCAKDFTKLSTIEGQQELLNAIKLVWKAEIEEGDQRTYEEKVKVKENIDKLRVIVPN